MDANRQSIVTGTALGIAFGATVFASSIPYVALNDGFRARQKPSAAEALIARFVLAHSFPDRVRKLRKSIVGNIVSVEKDGKVTELTLVMTTTYEVNGHPGKINDLRVGDRAVIHSMNMEGKETAHDVRFAHP